MPNTVLENEDDDILDLIFNEGYDAFGKDKNYDNPYIFEFSRYRAYKQGWERAKADHEIDHLDYGN